MTVIEKKDIPMGAPTEHPFVISRTFESGHEDMKQGWTGTFDPHTSKAAFTLEP